MDNKEIINQKNGIVSKDEESSLFIPNHELVNFGCKNCIWKLHGQCPHGITLDMDTLTDIQKEKLHIGYCDELGQWLLSLAGPTNSVAILWERYHTYHSQLQSQTDYNEYMKLQRKIENLNEQIESGEIEADKKYMMRLEAEKNSLKFWWTKLNDSVIRSMSHIADREARKEEGKNVEKITIQNLSILMNDARKELGNDR